MLNSSWFKNYPAAWFLLTLAVIAVVTAVGPAEKTLGVNIRAVYLHGAWVWAALIAFLAAAGMGLAGLVTRQLALHYWSRALGRTGLVFWITYLPLSLWAMQTNWNGLFLAEPRWRLGLIFATGGLVLQIGISLIENPAWASFGNLAYILTLFLALQKTPNVMHPPSPMLDSNAPAIQLYFSALVALVLLAGWQMARGWRRSDLCKAERHRL